MAGANALIIGGASRFSIHPNDSNRQADTDQISSLTQFKSAFLFLYFCTTRSAPEISKGAPVNVFPLRSKYDKEKANRNEKKLVS